jgi:hypothetical protein
MLKVIKMATKLSKMKIREVSLVSRPAIAKEFLLYKSMDGETMENEEIIKAETPEEIVKTETEEVEKGKKGDKKPKEPKPVKKEETESEVEKKEPMCKECGKVHKEGEACEGKVKKSAEDIVKELEIEKAAMAAKIAELEKAAYDAKQTEITKEFIAKADKELKHVPQVIPSKFGPVLKAASEKLAKEEYDAIYAALIGAEAIIKASSLTKELGVGGEDLSAEPAAQLEAIAKSIQDKDSSLTHAKAYQLACEKNPQIYAEHVRSTRRQ